jgi:ankyrin repeat and BTB/POZ domain-containing protein 1
VIDSEDFHDLVREDAAQVKGRQETDSIPIIDDLRFLVSRKELLESHKRLQMIDNLLDKLGLEA